jgi:CRP-like cAMP-binding protein
LLQSVKSGVERERDAAALRPHLTVMHLQQKRVLHNTGDMINKIYFPTTAVVSLVVALESGEMTEAAMVGKDGAVGIASALDGKLAINRAIVQLGGDAIVCDQAAFRSAALQSESLITTVMRHEQTLFAQAQQSAACMAYHEVDARFCRWMLRARDLSGSDQLPFTQEFLAEMLGVQRTSVNTVARTLQEAGLIKYRRGQIEIIDVEGLLEGACECYEVVKEQYSQLLGPAPTAP